MTNRAERRHRTEVTKQRHKRNRECIPRIRSGGRCTCSYCVNGRVRSYAAKDKPQQHLEDQILEEWADNEDDYTLRNPNCVSVRPFLDITTRGEARDRVLYWALAEGEARSFAELSKRISEWVDMLELDE
jgi:hypothetical protein